MLKKISKGKAVLSIVLITTLVLAGSHYMAYRAGLDHERAADAKRITDYKELVAKLKDQLHKEQQNIKVKYRERKVKIEQANDACADQPASPDILNQLRDNSS